MEEKKKSIFKRWWFWVIVVVIIAFAVSTNDDPETANNNDAITASTEANDEPKENSDPVNDPAEEDEQEEPALTFEEEIEKSIIESVDVETNTDKERIVSLKINDHAGTETEGDKIVLAELNADESLTSNTTKKGILIDSNGVFQSLFEIPEVEEVSLTWLLPLTDVYGNTSDGNVLKISLTREVADKINWDNIKIDNYSQIANIYWEHPAFSG